MGGERVNSGCSPRGSQAEIRNTIMSYLATFNKRLIATVAAIACLFAESQLLASNDFWRTHNGIWGDDANWSDGSRPGAGDHAFISLDGAYTVTFLADPTAIQALTVNGSANVAFTSNNFFQPSTLRVTSASGSRDVIVTDNAMLTLGTSGGIFGPDRPLHLIAGDDLIVRNGAKFTAAYGSNVTVSGLDIESGGQVNINGSGSLLTNDSYLTVGTAIPGTASMTIQNGGDVINNVAYVGGAPESTGTVTVTGAGSTWSNSDWIVVGAGNGQMFIQNAGSVSSRTGTLGWTTGSSGNVEVAGAGSDWTMSDELIVGERGTGQLTIANGGSVANTIATIGDTPGASGSVTVTGPGSAWSNSSQLHIGDEGTGSLSILNGGSVSNNGFSSIGAAFGSAGTVTVSGAGSSWINSGLLLVGRLGAGSLNITDGGTVSNTDAILGEFLTISPSSITVTVSGPGSNWINLGSLVVGQTTNATLMISAGGSASSAAATIGDHFTANDSAVTVTGAGSTWTNPGEFTVGYRDGAKGTLTIADGGSVATAHAFVGRLGPSSFPANGTVVVAGAGSTWTVNGRLSMGGDAGTGVDGGNGTLTAGQGGCVNVSQDIVLFPGGIVKLQGGALSTTAFDFRGGQFQWTQGTLHIDTFNGNLINPAGGILAPGRSAGFTTINGNYTQQSGAAVEIELGGTAISMHDFVSVSEAALLDGELQLKLIDGFTPKATDTFTVFATQGGMAGVFSNVTTGQRLETVDGRGSFLVHYGATSIYSPNQIVLTAFEASPLLLPGDYNQNGTVDAADYTLWRDNLGSPTSLPNDDTPGVAQDDYERWKSRVGQTGAGGGQLSAVPEPSGFLLLLAALPAVFLRSPATVAIWARF